MERNRVDALFFGHAARQVRLARLLGDDDPEDVVQEAFSSCTPRAAGSRPTRRRSWAT
jgi:DNA-directed RNA polymerase specialized sigma24 family protein